MRVGAQAVGLEILFAVVADGDALFGRARLAGAGVRPLACNFLRALGLAARFGGCARIARG